jgi:hypothetical protein
MLRGPAGILGQSSSLEIFDSDLSHQDDAIRLSHSTGDVYNCEIHTNTAAVALIDGSDVNIRDNVIFDGPFGVDCDHSSAHVTNNTFGAPPPAGQTVSVYSIDSSVDVRGNTMRWGDGGLSAIRSQVVFDGNHLSNMNGSGVYLGSSSALITNNIFYIGGYAVYSVSATTGEISNNTIDKYDVGMLSELGPTQLIRNNIISRGFWGIQCVNSLLTVECNDIFDMSSGPYDIGLCSVQPDESNFFTDPEYCGVDDSGNYFLQSDSPCAPGNHPDGYECGLIGALPVNCGKVDVEKKSWGSIKSMYKKDG